MKTETIEITHEMWPIVFKLQRSQDQLNALIAEHRKLLGEVGIPFGSNYRIDPDAGKITYAKAEQDPDPSADA